MYETDGIYLRAADISCDDNCNINDMTAPQRYSVYIKVPYPIGGRILKQGIHIQSAAVILRQTVSDFRDADFENKFLRKDKKMNH